MAVVIHNMLNKLFRFIRHRYNEKKNEEFESYSENLEVSILSDIICENFVESTAILAFGNPEEIPQEQVKDSHKTNIRLETHIEHHELIFHNKSESKWNNIWLKNGSEWILVQKINPEYFTTILSKLLGYIKIYYSLEKKYQTKERLEADYHFFSSFIGKHVIFNQTLEINNNSFLFHINNLSLIKE